MTQAFRYTALDEQGRQESGSIQAESRSVVADRLRKRGYRPLSIKPETNPGWFRNSWFGSGFRAQHRRVFTSQLAVLLESGIPLLKSIQVLEQQARNDAFREVLKDVGESVREGTSFSESLAEHPEIFGELYVNMIRAGERSGELDRVLHRLTEYSRQRRELSSRLINATAYPAVLTVCSLLVVLFFLNGVLPTFLSLFRDMDVPLPLITEYALVLSQTLNQAGGWILGLFLLAAAGVTLMVRSDYGRRRLDAWLLRVPWVGILVRDVQMVRVTRTLGTLLETDVPLLQGLSMVAETVGNRRFSEILLAARERVRGGDRLSESLRETGVFSPLSVHMMGVGEETGNLAEMLERIAETHEAALNRTVDRLGSLLEPILILVMGITVGLVVLAMVLPLFQVTRVLG